MLQDGDWLTHWYGGPCESLSVTRTGKSEFLTCKYHNIIITSAPCLLGDQFLLDFSAIILYALLVS
jgi:hypothetical protein